MRASLSKLGAVNGTCQTCAQHVGLPVDVLDRRNYRFREAGARLRGNILAQRDDLIVARQCPLEPIHRLDVLPNRTPQCVGERGFVRIDDLALEREDLAIARRRAPVPRCPLHLHTRKPVGVECVVEGIDTRTSVADATKRGDTRLVLREASSALTFEKLTRARELLVLGAT